jgi:hypothetical protein
MRWIWAVLALTCAGALGPAAARAEERGRHTEVGLFPVGGGSTDIGIGVGFLGSLTGVDPAVKPYRWRIEAAGFISAKKEDRIEVPYQDFYLLETLPQLFGGRGRLELRQSYTRETNLLYYGLGNASVAPADHLPARDFYRRRHPNALARLRLDLIGDLQAVIGTSFTENWIDFDPQSTLAKDLTSPDPRVHELLVVDRRVGVHLIELGLAFDHRDDEINPGCGQFHTLRVLLSPGHLEGLHHQYAEINAVARFYLTVWPERVVLAARLLGDAQLGDVPFFSLARYYPEDTSALGGSNGVRGIPSERYLGRWKAFGNLEARVTTFHWQVHGSPYAVGFVGFFDGGRVWSDLPRDPLLDGTGVGLKYGAGGGLRVVKGKTFVVRADLAWSPDANPLGGYIAAGQMF